VSAVHQFVPALIPRDATGSHTLLVRQALRQAGWTSEIFAEATHDELIGETIRVEEYAARARPGDVLLYQFSTSSMVADLLAARSEPLVLDYHNVTDPALNAPWDQASAERSAAARVQLAELAPRAVLGIADSAYNERDLVDAGCRRTAVVPVLVDFDRLTPSPEARLVERLRGGQPNWLFVGRIVPSKAQHRLIEALWAHRRLYGGGSRLHLVGAAPSGRYLASLRAFAADLGLRDAVRLAGEVSDAELAAYFAAADVYVSTSVHEGFGVPLVEALRAGVPVVAAAAGAVAETLGDAGLVLERSDPTLVAAAVERVLQDDALRQRLRQAGARRLETFGQGPARLVEVIATVAGAPPGRREQAS
jgi:glycosyltransferase involved in cell wall biosynthesis